MIDPSTLFSVANMLALAGWAALVVALFSERWRAPLLTLAGRVLPALFAALYVGAIAAGFATSSGGGYGSIPEVRALFASDYGLLAGWLHYLAFDLFVGAWILAASAVAGMRPLFVLPLLPLTFLFGPVGLLGFFILRAAMARRSEGRIA